MLARFTVKRIFNKLRVSLHVCNENRDASLMVMYDHRIIRVSEPIQHRDVDTPEKAEAYLRQPTGPLGSFVERLEWLCRTGQLTPVPDVEDAPLEARECA